MAKSELKVNLNIGIDRFKKELKIIHRHIGNMLEELNNICPECGSTEIETFTLRADNDEVIVQHIKCHDCRR